MPKKINKYCHIKVFVGSNKSIDQFMKGNYEDYLKKKTDEKIYLKKKFRLELRDNVTDEEIWGGFKRLMKKNGIEIVEDN